MTKVPNSCSAAAALYEQRYTCCCYSQHIILADLVELRLETPQRTNILQSMPVNATGSVKMPEEPQSLATHPPRSTRARRCDCSDTSRQPRATRQPTSKVRFETAQLPPPHPLPNTFLCLWKPATHRHTLPFTTTAKLSIPETISN